MSITDELDLIVRARWNPGEWFHIEDVVRIATQESITSARSTIQRTMQEIRDRGTVQFSDSRGNYLRKAVGIERDGDPHAITRQAVISIAGELGQYNAAQRMTAERVLRLMAEEPEDSRIVEDIKQIENEIYDSTERWTMVRTRLGQGDFRKQLIAYWKDCAVTRCKLTRILKAAHIKPWRDSTDAERLDVYNGLLLMPNVDSLFDVGLITIDNSGKIHKSALLQFVDGAHFGIPDEVVVMLEPKHHEYLEHHRAHIFAG